MNTLNKIFIFLGITFSIIFVSILVFKKENNIIIDNQKDSIIISLERINESNMIIIDSLKKRIDTVEIERIKVRIKYDTIIKNVSTYSDDYLDSLIFKGTGYNGL